MVNKTNYDAEPGGPEPNSTPDRPGPTFRDPTSDVAPTNTELLTYLQSVSTPHFNQAIRPYSLDQLVADGNLIDDAYTKWVTTTLPAKKPSKKKNKDTDSRQQWHKQQANSNRILSHQIQKTWRSLPWPQASQRPDLRCQTKADQFKV